MNPEFQLTAFYVAVGLASFVFVAVLVRFMRWADTMRHEPYSLACACLFIIGLLMLGASLMDVSSLSLDIPTPLGGIDSGWVGAVLVLTSITVRVLARRHQRAATRRSRPKY
jgi:TRAP-type C4-dicarboxylate transport system permease small subunit